MILRRIADSIRARDWFSFSIEFAIVVAGVFIGIQMANWNEERHARTEEARLVDQLLGEVAVAIDTKDDWIDLARPRLADFRQAIEIIQSQDSAATLSRSQCESVAFSHIIVFGVSTLPTLEEILSTGGLGILSNPQARTALMRYKSGLAEVEAAYDFVRDDFANLVDSYGDEFPRQYDVTGEAQHMPIASTVSCRLDIIREAQTLKNRIVSNLARTQSLIDRAETELALLHEVATALREATP